MRCKRCDQPFSSDSAIVTDHRYIDSCIKALKARIKELEGMALPPAPAVVYDGVSVVYVTSSSAATFEVK